MSRNLDQVLDWGVDLQGSGRSRKQRRLLLLAQPVGGPTDKVGGQGGQIFLQGESWLSPDFEMMHLENAFAFFDPSFDGLTAIVSLKPGF